MHCIWTLPEGDSDFPGAGVRSKTFSRNIEMRHIWQARFWEHTIRNDNDYRRHMDYIYLNPVKHGYVGKVVDWPFSTFHRDVREGLYPADWAAEIVDFAAGSGSKTPGKRSATRQYITTQSSKNQYPLLTSAASMARKEDLPGVAKGIGSQYQMAGDGFQRRAMRRIQLLAVDEDIFTDAQHA